MFTPMRYVTSRGFRAVLFVEEYGPHRAWVGICLEKDIGSQGKDPDQLVERLEASLVAHEVISRELGRAPYAGFDPSPQRYHDMWEQAGYEYPSVAQR